MHLEVEVTEVWLLSLGLKFATFQKAFSLLNKTADYDQYSLSHSAEGT